MAENCPPSISTAEKPTKHVSVKDWMKNVHNFQLRAEKERDEATLLRNEARQGRNEACISSTWARHNTNVQLSDRISEEQQWLHTLECSRRVLDDAAAQLTEEKAAAETQIEAYYRAITVVAQCFQLRDRRGARDLTYDDTHTQLKNELKLLESSKEELTEKCHEAWELMSRAHELSAVIEDNVRDKLTALNIDCSTLELSTDSPLIAYKPDVLNIRAGIVGHESWLQSAQSQQTDADVLTTQLTRHAEATRLQREKANMLYLTQVEATNYELRKRIYNANKLKNELNWQRQNTEEEMAKVQTEVEQLRVSETDHEKQLKCAETRQEDRNLRPALELVRDLPHDALLEEISQLRVSLRAVRDHIDKAMRRHKQLDELRNRLCDEIASKELCIQMEMRTLECRSCLLEHQPPGGLDANAVLVKMDKQLAPTALC